LRNRRHRANTFEIDRYTILGFIPENAYDSPAPIVLNLHPTSGSELRSLNDARPIAEKESFVMIAPTGTVCPVFSSWT